MKIIKETSRRVGVVKTYQGVCNSCGTPLEYDDELALIEIEETEERYITIPIDCLVCPACNKQMQIVYIYKNMDISGEIAQLTKGEKE